MAQELRRVGCEPIERVGGTYGVMAELRVQPAGRFVALHAGVTARALAAARKIGFGDGQLQTLPPQGGGEDFAYYCQKAPGAFVYLGAANEQKACSFPHHHPKFNIDEDALAWGAALHA